MSDKLFSFIIKDTKSNNILESMTKQNITNWECFIIGEPNNAKQFIESDSRFHIINSSGNKSDDINNAIKQVSGQYVIILNSSDYFIPNAFDYIYEMIEPTDADIIVYSTLFVEKRPELDENKHKYSFSYTVRRQAIMKNMFDSLSEFCFKREFLQSVIYCQPEELFIFNILANTSAIVKSGLICVLEETRNLDIASSEYRLLIDNFNKHKKSFDNKFWKMYFRNIIPRLLDAGVYQHDRFSLKYCAKNIPGKYIPWKYKFMLWFAKNI